DLARVPASRVRAVSPAGRRNEAAAWRARSRSRDRAAPARAARRLGAGGERRCWARRNLHRALAACLRDGALGWRACDSGTRLTRMSRPATGPAVARASEALKALLGSRANDSAVVREHHSAGESYHTPAAPDIVCFPHTTAEVAAILKISAVHGLPVVPFGAGTSLEGHVNAIDGGISIDLREMNTI